MYMLIVLVVCKVVCAADETVSVTTNLGVINGKVVKIKFRDHEFSSKQFLGVPYGKHPTGTLRFKKPEPYGRFETPFEAFEFGTACPQNDVLDYGLESKNEDCLSLNIYVPTTPTSSPPDYAVLIFIHGGGFVMGSSAMIPGDVLTSYGNIVFVSINYRLGMFGFASTGDEMAPGNQGLWDQRLAVQWVNENIAAFGGDPSRITIMGESAGAMSVFIQGLYPQNTGLFQNIIAQSGAPTMSLKSAMDNKAAMSIIADNVDCANENFDEAFICLQNVDTDTIKTKLNELLAKPEFQMTLQFLPTIDGEFLKRDPHETIALAKETALDDVDFFRTLRVITGLNNAEGGMWLQMLAAGSDTETMVISHEDIKNIHIPFMLPMVTNKQQVPELLKSIVAYEYTDWFHPENARLQYVKFVGDMFFNVPGVEWGLLRANSSDSNIWMYQFAANVEKNVMPMPSWMKGANHGDDLMPIFGYTMKGYGELGSITDYVPPEWELDLSQAMMTMWANFVKTG